jgi:hypothetical protein
MNYGMVTRGKKEKRTSKKNMDGRSTNSHDSKKFITRLMEKQSRMAFGFRKKVTAVLEVCVCYVKGRSGGRIISVVL